MKEKNYINDHFESHIRDTISGHRSNFDGERMWNNLDGKIPGPPAPKRRLAWMWFAGFALMAFIGGHLFVAETGSEEEVLLAESLIEAPETTEKSDRPEFTTSQPDVLSSEEAGQDMVLQKPGLSDNEIETRLLSESSGANTPSYQGSVNTGSPPVISSGILRIDAKIMGTPVELASIEKMSLFETRQPLVAISRLQAKGITEIMFNEEEEISDLSSFEEHLTEYKSRWDLALSVLGGLHITRNTWSYADHEGEEWVQNRKETESSLETIETGFALDLISPIDLGLRTGLSYVQQNELFEAKIYNRVVRHDPLEMGPEELTADTVIRTLDYITESTARKIRNYNRHSILRIPLQLTYHGAFKGWVLGAAAGMTLNIPLKSQGKSLGYEYSYILNWEENDVCRYTTTPYWNYQAQLSIGRYLAPGLILSLEPVYSATKGSILESELGVGQTQESFGVNLRLSRFF